MCCWCEVLRIHFPCDNSHLDIVTCQLSSNLAIVPWMFSRVNSFPHVMSQNPLVSTLSCTNYFVCPWNIIFALYFVNGLVTLPKRKNPQHISLISYLHVLICPHMLCLIGKWLIVLVQESELDTARSAHPVHVRLPRTSRHVRKQTREGAIENGIALMWCCTARLF